MPKKAVAAVEQPGIRPANAPTDVPYFSDIPLLAESGELMQLVAHRQALNKNIELMKAEIEETLNPAISHLLAIAKVDSVGVDHWKVTRASGRVSRTLTGASLLAQRVAADKIAAAASKVDAQALLGLGVPATTIKLATVETTGDPYLMVTDASKKRGEGK